MKDNKHQLVPTGFCSRCGITLMVELPETGLPQICRECIDEIGGGSFHVRPAFGASRAGVFFHVVTALGELGPPRRPKDIERWPHMAFSVLCEGREFRFPYTRWTFQERMLPAVERMVDRLGKSLIFYR
ncbi:hypothetical protein KJ975_08375 [Myxococcota bacterium]|nr:hypothetical protein [Myxococcota bacterium]